MKKPASFVLAALRGLRGLAPALPDFGELSRGVPVPLFKQGQSPVGRDFGELSRAARQGRAGEKDAFLSILRGHSPRWSTCQVFDCSSM
ncbi:MAG: hypothetical protein EWM72_01029 [Nitrospira sp.]|nr:MAG: hypothetical protein EWM72_01029 [Nitrospira sp.]